MIPMTKAVQRLILHEGLRLKPYVCSKGYLTIGVGRNLVTNPLTAEEKAHLGHKNLKDGITQNEAIYLLENDIRKYQYLCRKHIPFFEDLSDERQYALLDMAFNLGISGLLKFKKMLAAMCIGDYRGAAKECMNSRYAKDVGVRAQRIAMLIQTEIWRV